MSLVFRRISLVVTVAAMMLSLVGCHTESSTQTTSTTKATTSTTETATTATVTATATTTTLTTFVTTAATTKPTTVVTTTAHMASTTKPHVHRSGEWETETPASCQEKGTNVRLCLDCHAVLEEAVLPKLTHTFDNGICTLCFTVDIDDEARVNSLGNLYHGIYGANSAACVAWDLKIYDGMLHRGAGDYDLNTGAMVLWAYNLATEQWECTGVAGDEEISRFIEIDGELYTPGTDATGDWSLGNYYCLDVDENWWTKFRTIPGGVHVWDIAKHDGKTFFGLGVDPQTRSTPLAYTTDGKEFTFVPLYKNGVPNDDMSGVGVIRAYELFTCGGSLFAYVQTSRGSMQCEIYRFENDTFVYVADAPQFLGGVRNTYRHFAGDGEFGGATYVVQNHLYRTTDGATFTKIDMPNNAWVADMLIADGKLRVLTYAYNTSKSIYDIVVYELKNGVPTEECRFEYALPPIAFEHDGEYFYLAVGRAAGEDLRNGLIFRIKP